MLAMKVLWSKRGVSAQDWNALAFTAALTHMRYLDPWASWR